MPMYTGKTSKKTTFSLNQTTWSDHARSKPNSEIDSDSQSETSETGGDRKPFSDVKILLEEKRKVKLNMHYLVFAVASWFEEKKR